MKIKTCCLPADWTNAVDCTFFTFQQGTRSKRQFSETEEVGMLGLSCGFDFVGYKQFRDVNLRCVSSDVGWKGSLRYALESPRGYSKHQLSNVESC